MTLKPKINQLCKCWINISFHFIVMLENIGFILIEITHKECGCSFVLISHLKWCFSWRLWTSPAKSIFNLTLNNPVVCQWQYMELFYWLKNANPLSSHGWKRDYQMSAWVYIEKSKLRLKAISFASNQNEWMHMPTIASLQPVIIKK